MTRQEKLVIYFLIAMLVLGLAVKFHKAKAAGPDLKIGHVDIAKIAREKSAVKINSATAQDLIRLPGIGAGLAQRIVDYRSKNGNFAAKEDLKKVSGIGDKKYEAVKDYLIID